METRGAGRKRRWFGVPILLALVLASWEVWLVLRNCWPAARLAGDGVACAGVLVALEPGRNWPRERRRCDRVWHVVAKIPFAMETDDRPSDRERTQLERTFLRGIKNAWPVARTAVKRGEGG
jgi:hypothetical protein